MKSVILFSLFNNALMFCLNKWKWIEIYELHQGDKKYLPDWCNFCFFFWCGFVERIYVGLGESISLGFFGYVFFYAMCIAFTSGYINKLYYYDPNRNRE